jgi:hypothetical protein
MVGWVYKDIGKQNNRVVGPHIVDKMKVIYTVLSVPQPPVVLKQLRNSA